MNSVVTIIQATLYEASQQVRYSDIAHLHRAQILCFYSHNLVFSLYFHGTSGSTQDQQQHWGLQHIPIKSHLNHCTVQFMKITPLTNSIYPWNLSITTHHILRYVLSTLGQRAAEVSWWTSLCSWSWAASTASRSVAGMHGLHAWLWKRDTNL